MNNQISDDLIRREEDWNRAIVANDAAAIGQFVSEDWIIVSPDGNVVERTRFLAAIESGQLIHRSMDSEEFRCKVYGDAAVVTAVIRSKGEFAGNAFTTRERSTSVYAKIDGRWKCVLTQLTSVAKS